MKLFNSAHFKIDRGWYDVQMVANPSKAVLVTVVAVMAVAGIFFGYEAWLMITESNGFLPHP